jgi:ATP-dependent DNA ligase
MVTTMLKTAHLAKAFHMTFIAAERHGLEGIVSKLRDVPYRSGECREWVKIKNRRLARCRPGTMAIA